MFQSLKKTKQSKEYTQINDQETNSPNTSLPKHLFNLKNDSRSQI